MESAIAKGIVGAGNDLGLDLKLYEGYSGRGMYGRKTDGVEGSETAFMAALVAFTIETAQDESYHDFKGTDRPEDAVQSDAIVEAMTNLRTDSMGRSDLIYY